MLDRTDTGIETARVKLASAEVRIVRAANYARVVEDALRRTPGNAELEEELGRSRDELAAARREKDELEAEQRLAEAVQRRAFYAKEQREDRRERATFGRIARWQHAATYLLYFVMLMNVFITTFGISGGKHDTVISVPRQDVIVAATSGHVAPDLTLRDRKSHSVLLLPVTWPTLPCHRAHVTDSRHFRSRGHRSDVNHNVVIDYDDEVRRCGRPV